MNFNTLAVFEQHPIKEQNSYQEKLHEKLAGLLWITIKKILIITSAERISPNFETENRT